MLRCATTRRIIGCIAISLVTDVEPLMRLFDLILLVVSGVSLLSRPTVAASPATETPIEHLIVVVGENISFDCLFATYEPPPGVQVGNLLSRGIVDRDGQPGPRFAEALQRQASVRESFSVTPPISGAFAT